MHDDKNIAKYWNGTENRIYRYWYYIKQGVGVLNELRNLFFIILGTCFTFKEQFPILKNISVVAGIFGVAFLILFIVGYIFTHKVNKVTDWLSIQFGTVWGRYQYSLLEEIRDAVKSKQCGCEKA